MAEVAAHLQDARLALVWAARQAAETVMREAAGAVILDRQGLLALPHELQRRVLIAAVNWLAGRGQSPRGAKVDRFLTAATRGGDATLAGCRLRHRPEGLVLMREQRAVGGAVATDALWDGRWQVAGPGGAGLHVAALGAGGLRHCPDWRLTGVTRDVLLVSPGIWRGDALIAAPCAGLANGWKARIVAGPQTFLVSH